MLGPDYCWWGGMWIFPVTMILVMLVFVFLFFGRGGFRPPWWHDEGPPRDRTESPLDILKTRYAKGEITKEQFEQMRRDLLG